LLSGLDWLLQILARRTMNQKHTRSAASLALANQSAIEPHVVMASDSNAEYRRLTVDGNASCANPVLHLAARRQTCSRKHLLEALPFVATLTASANIAGRKVGTATWSDIGSVTLYSVALRGSRLAAATSKNCASGPRFPSSTPHALTATNITAGSTARVSPHGAMLTARPTLIAACSSITTAGLTLATADLTLAAADLTLAAVDLTLAAVDPTLAAVDPTLATADPTLATANATLAPADATLAPANATLAPANATLAPADATLTTADFTFAAAFCPLVVVGPSLANAGTSRFVLKVSIAASPCTASETCRAADASLTTAVIGCVAASTSLVGARTPRAITSATFVAADASLTTAVIACVAASTSLVGAGAS
jgi:hypothetical protein